MILWNIVYSIVLFVLCHNNQIVVVCAMVYYCSIHISFFLFIKCISYLFLSHEQRLYRSYFIGLLHFQPSMQQPILLKQVGYFGCFYMSQQLKLLQSDLWKSTVPRNRGCLWFKTTGSLYSVVFHPLHSDEVYLGSEW